MNVGLLDKVMTLVGELVLARNQVLQYTGRVQDAGFLAASQRLNLITTELQEGIMKTRMQPIGNIWGQFPRTVRDVALGCGKQVNIEMEGKETELDKTIIEAIKDPLTHLVRNSVDHGIELPDDRVKQGKNATGRLILRAFHEGGQVNIEISDDGAGLNASRIRKKALERAVITGAQAERMSEQEIFNLIFLPGFSTAEKVTNVSGRGVGMDVVKTNVERIGGSVGVQSTVGQGTTVKVKIPLTLAIIPALVVTCAGERYAIPQLSLLELVRLEGEKARKGVELVHGAPVYRLRGRLLPLVYLDRELGVATDSNGPSAAHDLVNIVVLQADERQFGLVVDHINDTEEIVVKPLRKQLKGIKTFAGSSIMGDGRVALILDILGLAQRANMVTQSREHSVSEKAAELGHEAAEKQTFLLFSGPGRLTLRDSTEHAGAAGRVSHGASGNVRQPMGDAVSRSDLAFDSPQRGDGRTSCQAPGAASRAAGRRFGADSGAGIKPRRPILWISSGTDCRHCRRPGGCENRCDPGVGALFGGHRRAGNGIAGYSIHCSQSRLGSHKSERSSSGGRRELSHGKDFTVLHILPG